jgi:hypothetical protein
MKIRLKKLALVAVAIGALLVVATPSNAGFQITFTTGAFTQTIVDNTGLDTNPAVNVIQANFTLDGYSINVQASTNTPGVGLNAVQTANSITVTNLSATNALVIDVQATGYNLGTNSGTLTNSESTSSLNSGATASAVSQVNGGQQSTAVTLVGPTVSGSGATMESVSLTTPFTLDSIMTLTSTPNTNANNITWTTSVAGTNIPPPPIPAPTDLLLLISGSPALGLGYLLRRRMLRA